MKYNAVSRSLHVLCWCECENEWRRVYQELWRFFRNLVQTRTAACSKCIRIHIPHIWNISLNGVHFWFLLSQRLIQKRALYQIMSLVRMLLLAWKHTASSQKADAVYMADAGYIYIYPAYNVAAHTFDKPVGVTRLVNHLLSVLEDQGIQSSRVPILTSWVQNMVKSK